MPEADRLRLAGRLPADYVGYGYAPLLADDMKAVAAVASDVAASSTQADASVVAAAAQATLATGSVTSATAQATAAQNSRLAAEAAVASVTVGSTDSLAYPEQVRNLITAADVVDVIVYDTRLDSDGGAWTERCTGTSWYNETLNTATRGVKRAFPKVALIVARSSDITIYDALDLDPATGVPRMWMVFNRVGTDVTMLRMAGTINGIAARNGQLARTVTDSQRALVLIDFIEDAAVLVRNSDTRRRLFIGDRNVSNSALYFITSGYPAITSVGVYGVDLAVLPGAPISPVTGLAMPSVLLTEAGSFRVLHPTGPGAARSAATTLTGGYRRARFTPDNRIIAIGETAPTIADVGPVPYAASTANTAWRTHRVGASSIGATGGIILPGVNGVGTLVDMAPGAIAQTPQVNIIAEDLGNAPNSMVASIGPDFATGWMPSSNIQLASLGDGATGNVTGTGNLVVNGDFTTSMTGWTNQSATSAAVSGAAEITSAGVAGAPGIARTFTVVAGQTYTASARLERISGRQNVTLQLAGAAIGTTRTAGQTTVGWANVNFSFTAVSSGTLTLTLYENDAASSAGLSFRADDVTCTLVAADRSYIQRGLEVVGMLSRAVVATDAELVAYSGFSASNYLTQPSNAALAVTTGDVSFMGWVNVSSFAAAFPLASVQGTDGLELGVGTGGFNFRLQSATAGTNLTVTGTTTTTGQWAFVVGLRRAGVLEIWVNGQREATLAAAGTMTNTPGALEVARSANASALTGIALLRIATYAPTPGQIQRMYRDERPLFAAGGKAFLGGASSATVRQLSRSRYTNRLGVAMSDGLAVLDGLVRVERQTTGTLSPAMASNDVRAVAMEAGLTLIGTAANAGVRRAAITGLDLMAQNAPTPQASRIFRAQGATADATPLILSPRVFIRERELVVVRALITARVYGATDTESLTYERRATYFRDAGGNVTIRGSVQVVGTDVEVTGTADATLVIDTTAQTVAAQVTGIAATRLTWTVRFQVERTTQDSSYEEVI